MMIRIVLLVLGALIQGMFIQQEHQKKYVNAVILKGLASCMFVAAGALSYAASPDKLLVRLIFIGLALGFVGDVLLNLRFVFEKAGKKIFLAGIAAFLAGHILYLAAILPLCAKPVLPVLLGILLAGGLLWYIFTTMEVQKAYKIFGVFYLGAVFVMCCVAIANALALKTPFAWTYAIGAVFFTLSDVVLIFNTFGSTTRFSMRITNLALYYSGQALIAFSLFLA